MEPTTRICHHCRTKFRIDHRRCPRCRTVVPQEATPAQRARRTLLGRIVVAGCLMFAVVLGTLSMAGEPSAVAPIAQDPPPARRARVGAQRLVTDRTDKETPAVREQLPGVRARQAAPAETDDLVARLQEEIAAAPEAGDLHSRLGLRLFELQRFEPALTHLQRAADLEPQSATHRANLGRVYADLRRWARAADAYREAHGLTPGDAALSFSLAMALQKSGQDDAAVEAFRRAIELNPADASYRLAIAISYEALKRNGEAAAAYEEYLRLAPDDHDTARVKDHIAQLKGSF
jgi:tetratricopeptide (TPR) repeat protein